MLRADAEPALEQTGKHGHAFRLLEHRPRNALVRRAHDLVEYDGRFLRALDLVLCVLGAKRVGDRRERNDDGE